MQYALDRELNTKKRKKVFVDSKTIEPKILNLTKDKSSEDEFKEYFKENYAELDRLYNLNGV